MGESGSGKTTLVSLLQHIYPIQDGEIRIGSYQIKNLSNRSLRRYVGSVPQQIELFAGTIIENIALGDFNPDMQKITNIIEQLGLKEFIDRLPNGYNTIIGEHGTSLSGGERQRIAIARMMYIDQGKVAESGNHQSLLSKNGIYHRLWKEQFDEIDL